MNEAYVAGFLDGEGCFLIGEGITVKVSHTHYPTLERLKAHFGGSIAAHSSPSHTKPAWVWRVHSDRAASVCRAVLPHLIEKRPQAQALLSFHDTIGPRGRRPTPEMKLIREQAKETLRESRTH